MRNSTALVTAFAGSALLLAAPASAEPVITGKQVLSTAGSAAGGAVGGPVGGFVGGLVFRNLGKVFEKKPAKLPEAQAPPRIEAQPLQGDKPVDIKTVDASKDTIPTPDKSAIAQASAPTAAPDATLATGGEVQQAADVSSSAHPASGTLDAQLASLRQGSAAPAQ
jgi:hypothetical protein